ncbi:MAG: DNA repair protein RecN [Pseudomonadota bacterium]
MLRYLKISHLAVIDEVEVEFHDGFNVLTGETGAGKSILIGALNLVLGAKAPPDIIRTGEEEALVEALFEFQFPPAGEHFPDMPDKGPWELVITRKLFRSGRSRATINGALVTVAALQDLGKSLVSIFGQHEHQVLLDPSAHVEILDRFGGLGDLRKKVAKGFAAWTRAAGDLKEACAAVEELEKKRRENEEIADELASAGLREGEEEELRQERELLQKAVQIREKAYEAHQVLYSRSKGVSDLLADARKAVEYIVSVNPKLTKLRDNIEEVIYRVEDIALELRDVAHASECDPDRLERIEERLQLIRRLTRRFGTDIPGLMGILEEVSKHADEVFQARSRVKKLDADERLRRQAFLEAAKTLSLARRECGERLETVMKLELKELAMPEAQFAARFVEVPPEAASAGGLKKVEFQLSSNPGEALRPLARVASGGELSRIMLALKSLQAGHEGSETVIFDEVDTGIGGHTAQAVAARLARVARGRQVLCVTHLHQIAGIADHHLSVRKSVSQGRTRIEVVPLDQDQRLDELTRMLGAAPGSETVREHVRGLINAPTVEVTG